MLPLGWWPNGWSKWTLLRWVSPIVAVTQADGITICCRDAREERKAWHRARRSSQLWIDSLTVISYTIFAHKNKQWVMSIWQLANLFPMTNSHPPKFAVCVCVSTFFSAPTGGDGSSTLGWFNWFNCRGSTLLVNDDFRRLSHVNQCRLHSCFFIPSWSETESSRSSHHVRSTALGKGGGTWFGAPGFWAPWLSWSQLVTCWALDIGDLLRPPYFTLRVRCGGGLYVCFWVLAVATTKKSLNLVRLNYWDLLSTTVIWDFSFPHLFWSCYITKHKQS